MQCVVVEDGKAIPAISLCDCCGRQIDGEMVRSSRPSGPHGRGGRECADCNSYHGSQHKGTSAEKRQKKRDIVCANKTDPVKQCDFLKDKLLPYKERRAANGGRIAAGSHVAEEVVSRRNNRQ